MEYDTDNVFAKILRKELPAHIVEETEHTLTFMDLMPVRKGHALVIPKERAVNMFDLSAEGLGHVMEQTQRVAKASIAAFKSEGVMIVQLNNKGAGTVRLSLPHACDTYVWGITFITTWSRTGHQLRVSRRSLVVNTRTSWVNVDLSNGS